MLAAGAGTRLRPLSRLRPKVLCPVAGVPLVDGAIARLAPFAGSIAVNVHHGRELLTPHLAGRVHVAVEEREALGTAGALGNLRDWIGGRPVIVHNGDTWLPADLGRFVEGWDGERIRLLVVEDPARGDFGTMRYVGLALMPWTAVRDLRPDPTGLYEVSWRAASERGLLDLVVHDGDAVACDTPRDYLRANLLASGGASVIGAGAVVEGSVERTVVWPGGLVRRGEVLRDAIRVGDLFTVLVR